MISSVSLTANPGSPKTIQASASTNYRDSSRSILFGLKVPARKPSSRPGLFYLRSKYTSENPKTLIADNADSTDHAIYPP